LKSSTLAAQFSETRTVTDIRRRAGRNVEQHEAEFMAQTLTAELEKAHRTVIPVRWVEFGAFVIPVQRRPVTSPNWLRLAALIHFSLVQQVKQRLRSVCSPALSSHAEFAANQDTKGKS
jgi:hypothetical protein